jgi:hypothetical protein
VEEALAASSQILRKWLGYQVLHRKCFAALADIIEDK